MPLTILVNGRPLDPVRAVQSLLPLDTELACPACGRLGCIEASAPRTGVRFPGEDRALVPRQQDRRCQACGHRWMVVLPPESLQR